MMNRRQKVRGLRPAHGAATGLGEYALVAVALLVFGSTAACASTRGPAPQQQPTATAEQPRDRAGSQRAANRRGHVTADNGAGSAVDAAATARIPSPPADLPADVHRSWDALAAGNLADAEAFLSRSSAAVRDGAGATTLAGLVALRNDDVAGAKLRFEEALSRDPEFGAALYGLGVVAEMEGDRWRAIDLFERATQATPEMTAAWIALRVAELRQAEALLRSTATAGAGSSDGLAAYREAIELAPHLLSPYLELAELLQRRGDQVAALELLERAHRHVGDAPRLLERLVAAHTEGGDPERAVDLAQRLHDLRPDDARARTLLVAAKRHSERVLLPESLSNGFERRGRVVREELAALLSVRVRAIADAPEPREWLIMNDIGDGWATPHIGRVTALGIMEVFPNHQFAPELPVTRGMLADIIHRTLQRAGVTELGNEPASIRDVARQHRSYAAVRAAVSHGILETDSAGRFHILEPVTGSEVSRAIERLDSILQEKGRRVLLSSVSTRR